MDIKNQNLWEAGEKRVEWASWRMPVLARIKDRFEKERPLEGIRIGACLHVTTETANLLLALKAGGAKISLAASNPLSTQDDVAAFLAKHGIDVNAIRGEDQDTYYKHLEQVLSTNPSIIMDDGGDLTSLAHKEKKTDNIIGGTEETTTGVIRFRNMERDKVLKIPMIAVNDAKTKMMFDNVYGTGQSALDGIMRATNALIAGKVFIVAGYGNCGRGLANKARGMGARVIVTEVDPIKALQAVMDGFNVMPMKEAARIADFIVTVTGDKDIVRKEHFEVIKDGCILANAGHFDVEINKKDLEEMALDKKEIKPNVTEYKFKNGKGIFLLAEGRLVNLAAAEGHPADVMDMSFSNQALSVEYLIKNRGLEPKVYRVPGEIDRMVAKLKLESMGIDIDELTPEQRRYLSSWEEGT